MLNLHISLSFSEDALYQGWLSINIETEKSRGICTADQLASKFPISHYYKILGVKADTKPEEIKKAYFDKSKRYHPDLYPDDKGKLPSKPNSKRLNENDLKPR